MTQAFVPPEFVRDITERYAADGYTPAALTRMPAELAADGGADMLFERGDQLVLVQLKRSNRIVPTDKSSQLTQLARHVQQFPNVRLDVINLPDPIDVLPDREAIVSRANAAAEIAKGSSDPRVLKPRCSWRRQPPKTSSFACFEIAEDPLPFRRVRNSGGDRLVRRADDRRAVGPVAAVDRPPQRHRSRLDSRRGARGL